MSDRRPDPGAAPSDPAQAPPLEPVVFSTAAFAPTQQFDAYQARCAGVVEVAPEDDPQAGFVMENRLWPLGGLALSCVETAPVRYARTPELVRRDPIDHWTIALVRHGAGVHSAGGQEGALPPGRLQLGTLAAPFAGRRGAMAWQMLFLARDSFPELAGRFDGAIGTVPDGAPARLLADFLMGLEGHLARATEAERPAIAASVRAMVAACLAPSPERLARAAGPIDQVLAERAKALVRANLGASLLGPRLLCRQLGISRSRLYRLFESEGGVGRYIQRQRLLAARAALANPAEVQPIGVIAERLGFADASVFSRAYRAEFDMTPRETRLAARTGRLPGRRLDAAAQGQGLRDLLGAM